MVIRDTVRTFVAVEISSGVRSKAAWLVEKLRRTANRVIWTRPEQLHLTLKFLGEVPVVDIPRISATVASAAAELPPFEIEVGRLGAFPHVDRPRTIWLGVQRGGEQLVDLHDYLEQRLADLGFRPEGRRYRPHLTLGRVRQIDDFTIDELSQLLYQYEEFAAGVSDVSEVIVFSSELQRTGPLHEPLSYAPLIGV